MTSYGEETKLALKIMRKATEITEWFKKEGFKSFQKRDDSPVTYADYAAQIYIISKLKNKFPGDQIIAEEEISSNFDFSIESVIKKCFSTLRIELKEEFNELLAYRGTSSNRKWSIDPIDGTKGFQKGLSYAIGLGFMKLSELIMSVIAVPNYNEKGVAYFIAERNQGAKASYGGDKFLQIRVSTHSKLQTARMCQSLHYNKPWVQKFAKLSGIINLVRIDSMAKFCMIADGSADFYIKPLSIDRSYTWDFLPGDLLVKEAGGIVTDLNEKPLRYREEKCLISAPGLVASNGVLQHEVLDIIKKNKLLGNL